MISNYTADIRAKNSRKQSRAARAIQRTHRFTRKSNNGQLHDNNSYIDPSVRRHKPDYMMLIILIMLLLLGLIIIYSIGPALAIKHDLDESHFMYRQIAYLLIAGVAFAVTSMIPFRKWMKIQPYMTVIAVISCLLLLIPHFGKEVYGATRWIDLGPIQFQPAELVKFAIIFYLAYLLTNKIKQNKINSIPDTLYPFGIIMGLAGIFIAILQKDLGTMIAISVIMLTMLYFAEISAKNMSIVLGVLGIAMVFAIILFPHRLSRITTFLHPEDNADTSAYQINQALIAVGSGGVFGKGIGHGTQAYGYLPEAANDAIFAILSEKLGFIGTTITVGLFGTLLFRMLQVVRRASSVYTRLLAAGIFGWIMAHTVVNIGAILGLLPLTGITLPFISFGGSSLVLMMAGLGVMFRISRYTHHGSVNNLENNYEDFASWRRVGRTRYTAQNSRA